MTQDKAPVAIALRECAFPKELRLRELQELRLRRSAAGGYSDQPGDPEELPGDAVGLAFSGGGIRSATFCLGILQALAKHKLLGKIDYLSTVSGGGYAGAFLGRMFTRSWIGPKTPSAPEGQTGSRDGTESSSMSENNVQSIESVLTDMHSRPMNWLRESGRYLSPNGAGDAILAGAVYLRNWVATQAVIVFFILMVFVLSVLPRLFAYAYDVGPFVIRHGFVRTIWWSPYVFLPLLTLLLWMAPLGWAYWLTQSVRGRSGRQAIPPWVTTLLIALTSTVFAVVVLPTLTFAELMSSSRGIYSLAALYVALLSFLTLACWLVARVKSRKRTTATTHRERNLLSTSLAAALTMTTALLVFAMIDSIGQTSYAVLKHTGLELSPLKALVSATGLISLFALAQKAVLLLGRLPKGARPKIRLATFYWIMAAVIAGFVLVTLSAISHGFAWDWKIPRDNPGQALLDRNSTTSSPVIGAHQRLVIEETINGLPTRHFTAWQESVPSKQKIGAEKMSSWTVLTLWALLFLLSLAFGRTFAFLNLSSHQALYGARLTRAYLGATNPSRWSGDGQKLTEVIDSDGITMTDYVPQRKGGPIHIINTTLNETIGGQSQVEQRDRKGLPIAVGPCGMSVSVRHHALWRDEVAGDDSKDNRRDASVTSYRELEPIWSTMNENEFHLLAPSRSDSQSQGCHAVEMLSLGTWLSVSGAAFTTGLGSRTNLGLSLLLGFSNIRLGYWWDSQVKPSSRQSRTTPSVRKRIGEAFSSLFPVQTYLLDEFLARFHGPARIRWYLSDGGHFENTGCYELIRRRLPFIIVCDNGADPGYNFEDIANLVRLARLDLKAEIRFLTREELDKVVPSLRDYFGTLQDLVPRCDENHENFGTRKQPALSRGHAALARVYYEDIPHPGSTILFIKPSLLGRESHDVLQYYQSNLNFPQEPTLDQYFDQAQWESYRRLGELIGERLFSWPPGDDAWTPSRMAMIPETPGCHS